MHLFEKYSMKVKELEIKNESIVNDNTTDYPTTSTSSKKTHPSKKFNSSHEIKLLQISK